MTHRGKVEQKCVSGQKLSISSLDKDWKYFSIKGQTVNILGFAGHVTLSHLCNSVAVAIHKYGCVLVRFQLWTLKIENHIVIITVKYSFFDSFLSPKIISLMLYFFKIIKIVTYSLNLKKIKILKPFIAPGPHKNRQWGRVTHGHSLLTPALDHIVIVVTSNCLLHPLANPFGLSRF